MTEPSREIARDTGWVYAWRARAETYHVHLTQIGEGAHETHHLVIRQHERIAA